MILTVGLAWDAAALQAQQVSGVVRSGDGPVPGALVELIGAGGSAAASTVTGEDGAYILSAPPGEYRVRVERLGFRDWVSGPVDLRDASVTLEVQVDIDPIRLDGLDVVGERQCPSSPAQAQAAWDLYSAVVDVTKPVLDTESSDLYYVEITEDIPERPWNASLAYLRLEAAPTETLLVRAPLSTNSPRELAAHGFVTATADAGLQFLAPDLATVVSPEFADTHCFSRIDEPGASHAGLAFEPIPGRTVPDVEGVLWVDSSSGRPLSLEFRFTRVREMLREHQMPPILANIHDRLAEDPRVDGYRLVLGSIVLRQEFGGRLEFEALADDRWLLRRWEMVVPILALQGGGLEWRERPAVLSARPTAFPRVRRGEVVAVVSRH